MKKESLIISRQWCMPNKNTFDERFNMLSDVNKYVLARKFFIVFDEDFSIIIPETYTPKSTEPSYDGHPLCKGIGKYILFQESTR